MTATELAQPDDDSLTELDARTHVLLYQKFADDKWVVEHCVSGEVVELEEGPTEWALQYSHDKAQYFVIGTGGGVPKPVRRWLRKFVLEYRVWGDTDGNFWMRRSGDELFLQGLQARIGSTGQVLQRDPC